MEVKNPHDDPARAKARKEQEDPWVMYFAVRESLGMSAGKTAAQVGHAVGILYGNYIKLIRDIDLCIDEFCGYARRPEDLKPEDMAKLIKITDFEDWMKGSFRKIVLRAKDGQWERLKEELECHVVRDAGFTEVEPGSETVIGLWPMRKSQRPNILKKLQVLK